MSLPLATVATQFLDRPNLAPKTAVAYEIALLPFLEKYGRLYIHTLDSRIVYSYLKSQTHLSSSTQKRHKAILQSLFNYAIEQGYAKTNPLGSIRRPKRYTPAANTNITPPPISSGQLELLYRAIGHDCRLQVLARLSQSSGASFRQLLSLDLSDIDLSDRQFTVKVKGDRLKPFQYSDDVTPWLKKYLRFYRHDSTEAFFTAQHPVTKKVTRLSYRRVHQQWCKITKLNTQLEAVKMQDLKRLYRYF